MSEKVTEKTNVYQRIHAVMRDVSPVVKESGKGIPYSFASHDGVVSVIKPMLVEHGLVIIPTIRDWSRESEYTEVNLDVSVVNIDDPEDRVSVSSLGYGIDKQDKGPGKAVSYAYKYALLKLFALETGDDVERDSREYVPQGPRRSTPQKPAQVAPAKVQPAQLERMAAAYLKDFGLGTAQLEQYLGHPLASCTEAEFTRLRDVYKSIKDGNSAEPYFPGFAGREPGEEG